MVELGKRPRLSKEEDVNEARLVAYLDHPGVKSASAPPFVGLGLSDDMTEGAEWRTLHQLVVSYGLWAEPLSLPQSLKVFGRLCEILGYAHNKGVLHLHLSPDSVMVGSFGDVSILEWGRARLFRPGLYTSFLEASGASLEEHGLLDLGEGGGEQAQPGLMPLEQLHRPHTDLTPAADVFSAGVLLYYMLTGEYPFPASNLRDYAVQLHIAPPSLRELRDDLPHQLSELCRRMLLPNPKERHQSFVEVLEELEELSNTGSQFHLQTYGAGEVLFQEGELGDYALQIVEGEVEISLQVGGQKKIINTRSKGDFIGELAVFSEQRRTATVTASKATTVRVMGREEIEYELDKLPPWIGQMVRSLSHKFANKAKAASIEDEQ